MSNNNNVKNIISSGSSASAIKETTTTSFTKSSTGTTIASSSSSSPPPPPPPPAGRQNKPSIAGTKSNHIYTFPSTTTITTTNNQQQQQQPIVCSLCSSHDVTEVNVKIKSCQNCSNVVVDEIACSSNASSASNTVVEAGSQSYYQHLAVITKKLKNLYKTKVHSVSSDTQQQQQQQKQQLEQDEPQFEMRKRSTNVVGQSQRPTFMKTRSAAGNSLVASDAVNNKTDKLPSPDCDHHHQQQQQQRQQLHQQQQQHKHHDHHKCSSNSSSVSKAPLNKTSSDKNKKHNKDVLILRICDLDVKEKSDVIELSGKKSTSPIDCNISNHTSATSGKTYKLLNNDKKSIKSRGTQIESGTTRLIKNDSSSSSNIKPPPSVRKIVVISEEYKKNSEKNDFRIENRKEIIKKFKQNNAISKSLDVILPQSDWDLHNGIDNSPYVFTSKSVTNLNDIIIDDDDDDGPFESINSVELIFISDEFLNKAIKHDLKILKGTKTSDTLNIDNSTQSSSAIPITIQQQQQQQQLPQHPQQLIKKKSKKLQKSPSPRSKESPSPISISERGTQSFSRTSGGGLNSSKKLIVISEDFKRKSLENNIVIVDDGGDNTETAIKRKNFKHLKLTRQQSSIDDVGNQMTSHAFCSFEEPDEQCLESKDIKVSD